MDRSTSSPSATNPSGSRIAVEPWPSEGPLMALNVLVAALVWLLLIVSVIGIVYAVFLALFFFVVNLAFIGHVRGSAVRLGPNQFPELYAAVESLARRMEMTPVPETYLMQAGGSLNAFATKFLTANIIVLHSELLVACGENRAARDMIIAHELGHLKAGHLTLRWLILPATFVPFLATALSRAREYTADRYGLAGAGDKDGATLGLAILAAGAQHGPHVNRQELVRQRQTMARSALMTFAEWFGTHPPLSKRIAQVDPTLTGGEPMAIGGRVRALAVLVAIPVALGVSIALIAGTATVKQFRAAMDSASAARANVGAGGDYAAPSRYVPPNADQLVRADLASLARFVDDERRGGGALPWNVSQLEAAFKAQYPRSTFPSDPYDGTPYGYELRGGEFTLWSIGPDRESGTEDDIRYDSRIKRVVVGHGAR